MKKIAGFVIVLLVVCALIFGASFMVRSQKQETEKEEAAVPTQETTLPPAEPTEEAAAEEPSEEEPSEEKSSEKEVSPEKTSGEKTGKEKTPEKKASDGKAELRERIAKLPLEDKIAQMFMVAPEQLIDVDAVTSAGDATRAAINERPVGGIIYFNQNLQSPGQVQEMTAGVNEYSIDRIGVPMFLAVDEEGGQVTRICGNEGFDVPAFPYISEIGQSRDTQQAYTLGEQIGSYLHEYGLNVDFAPVADILTNPDNQVVKYRSFGSDSQVVSEMALAQYQGLADEGVLGVYKHFPGHGATTGDTHEGYAYIETNREELYERELAPYRAGIEAGVNMIMAGHISCPNITGDSTPATLSPVLLTDILRGDLGYEGIIITDAMNMGAVTEQYTSGEAAVAAVKAGVDMILMPLDFAEAYQGILSAVESGELTEERIDESVYRIWKVKMQL